MKIEIIIDGFLSACTQSTHQMAIGMFVLSAYSRIITLDERTQSTRNAPPTEHRGFNGKLLAWCG
ncbi:hypothetical protein [Poseidonia sp.]|uniref:hypothetical protein n=1 Tax=Poseidonia sp. TaxID=2666344 RepID=UPI003F69B03C